MGTTACCLLAPTNGLAQETQTEPAAETQPADAPADSDEDVVSQLQVMVVCDTSELSSDPELIEEQVMIRTKFVLESVGLIPARVPDYMLIRVTLQPIEGTSGYTATLIAEKAGTPVEGATRDVDCKLCTASELVVQVQKEFGTLIQQLYPDRGVPNSGEPPPESTTDTATEPTTQTTTEPVDDPRKLKGLGKAGIGVLVGGIVGVGAGIGLIAYGERPRSSDPLDLLNLRPAGIGTLAAGIALTIAGGVMIGIDRKRAKQQRVSVAPMVPVAGSPGGLLLHGRF